jgi:hypothetical protein
MKAEKSLINMKDWLKTAVLLAIFGLVTAKSEAQLGTPPVIAVQPVGIAVQNGGTGLLTTTAISISSMKFYWLLNGQPVPTNDTSVLNVVVPLTGTISTLTVKNVSASGTYSVKVMNGVGSVMSSNAPLVVVGSIVSNVLSIVSSGTGMIASGFKLQLSVPTGSNYVIQATTDLVSWTSIYTNVAASNSVTYTDAAALNLPNRYYRAKLQ